MHVVFLLKLEAKFYLSLIAFYIRMVQLRASLRHTSVNALTSQVSCEVQWFTCVSYASKHITRARNYTHKLCYVRFVRTNTRSQASSIACAHKLARELCHAIMRVKLSVHTNMVAEKGQARFGSDGPPQVMHNYTILSNVHCLEQS